MADAGSRPSGDDRSVPGQVPPLSTSGSAPGPGSGPAAPVSAPVESRPALLAPAVRHRFLRPTDSDAWHVGFSPTGEALPDTLTDVLLRGSHAIRSSKRAEAQRLERAAAVAHHVDAQIRDFLDFCAAEHLTPPVTVRASSARSRRSAASRYADHPLPGIDAHLRAETAPRDEWPEQDADGPGPDGRAGRGRHGRRGGSDGRGGHDRRPGHGGPDGRGERDGLDRRAVRPGVDDHGAARRRRPHRRERLQAWPLLYWRCESFPVAGRSLHLFVEPGGRAFEGRDDPAPLTVLGREVRVWPVDAAAIVAEMAEVDARRCALQLVHGMAHLLWRAGVGL
ncbi:hypothetical protein [Frankia canadensis]|uniref:hypothetical protein n=1 Tax=Frankia canadensis TaxID=1836972 RepID=UPI000C7B73BC|nr:hypothetical protein [Frankia canadensis]